MFCIICSTLISLIILLHDIHPPFQFATTYNILSPSGFSQHICGSVRQKLQIQFHISDSPFFLRPIRARLLFNYWAS